MTANVKFLTSGLRWQAMQCEAAPFHEIFMLGRVTSDSEFRQQVVDIVVAGDLFETRSGPIGLAIGGQRRRDTASFRFDATTNSNNLDFAFGAQDWDGELTTLAAFFEIAIPFDTAIGDFDINFALRFEDFDEIDTDTTDPKISVMWRINDAWTLRASAGDSFRVPSLQQLFGTITTVANETDVGGDSAFRPSISTGNESLKPEESSNFNLGVSWAPQQGGFLGFLDGFQIDLDYYDYEYEDIITRQQTRTLLSEDNAALQAAMAGGLTLIEAVDAGIGNRDQIIRSGQGLFLRAEPDFENANSADVEGLDLSASYSFDTAWGAWRVGLQMAWLKTYDVIVTSTDGSIVKFDAVGEFNQNNPVARPLPEYKTNMTLNWSLNRHRVFVLVQFVDDVNFGDPRLDGASNFWRETIRVKLGQSTSDKFFTSTIDSQTTADIQYTYSFGEAGVFADSNIVLGVKNFTDEKPPWAPVNTGFEGTLHSPLGRIWFVKVGASL